MEQFESPMLCAELDKADSRADRLAMRRIFLIGPLSGLLICLAELQALVSVYLWLGDAIVLPRFKLHLQLRFYWHLAGCVLLGIAIVWLALLAARRLRRVLKTWPLLVVPLCASLVIFVVVFSAPGQWGVVPATPLWVWPLVTIAAVIAMLLTARPTSQPLPRLWPGLWRLYQGNGQWQALIAVLAIAVASWASYNLPERNVLYPSISLLLLNFILLLAAAVENFYKRRWRKGLAPCLVLLLSVPLVGAGGSMVVMGAMMGPMSYWGNNEVMIRMAKDFGGLADLPPSARNVDAIVMGGAFTLPVYLRFQADPAELESWIESSPGLTPAEDIPIWFRESMIWTEEEFGSSPRIFDAHNEGVGGRVVINDETHTVFIHVSWS